MSDLTKTTRLGWRAQLGVGLGLIFVAALGRLLPHPPNATPVAGAALLAGSVMSRRSLALLVPLLALVLSDLLIGFYSWSVLLAVYVCLLLPAVLGRWVARGPGRYMQVTGLAFTGAVAFFVITNLAVWGFTPSYPSTTAGLLACFAAVIPFFKYTLLGDLAWALSLFVVFDTLTHAAHCYNTRPATLPHPA